MSDQSVVKLMYINLFGLNNSGFKTWVTNVENMLIKASLTKVWEDQLCSVAGIHNFRTRLYDELLPDGKTVYMFY